MVGHATLGETYPFRAFLPVFPRPAHDQPISSPRGWQSHFDSQHSGLWLSSPHHHPSLEAFLTEARSRAEKRLDILSVMGAGHHIVPYRNRDVLALRHDEGSQELLIRSPHILFLPYGMRTGQADVPLAQEPETTTVIYHDSMRYFRLAQVSADAFGCFAYLYRALESMLDEICPYDSGREKEWFEAAIEKALGSCRPHTLKALGEHASPASFTSLVYLEVRNGLFHAKTKSRKPLTPLDPQAVARVRNASRLVTLVFVDLLRSRIPIGRGERVNTDLDMHEHSFLPPNLKGLRLLLEGNVPDDHLFEFTVQRDDEHLGNLLVGQTLPEERIPDKVIKGVQVVSEKGPALNVVFDSLIDGSVLDSLIVQVFMAADFDLGHRTMGWIPEVGVRIVPPLGYGPGADR